MKFPSFARKPRHHLISFLLLVWIMIPGCASHLGSRALPRVRINYNEALATSSDQQLLLNLVRLRHQHPAQFLELSSVVTQYSLTTNAGINGGGNFVGPGSFAPLGTIGGQAGVSLTERPTVTYTPLQGPDFVRRLATPIPAETIVLLLDAGWTIDVLMECCVQQINDVYAPVIAARDESSDFHRIARLLEQVHARHEISVEMDISNPDKARWLVFRINDNGSVSDEAKQALELLGVDASLHRFHVTSMGMARVANEIRIHGRSLSSAMFYLSQGVAVAADDQSARPLGVKLPLSNPLLHVRVQEREPRAAFSAITYRGRWYYIDDRDIASKRMFSALHFLFSLMSAPTNQSPLLTVPTG